MKGKPLHVRVAEALGWTGTFIPLGGGPWYGKPPGGLKQGIFYGEALMSDITGMSGILVPEYDRDWDAMGPEVEKLLADGRGLILHSWERVEPRKELPFQAYLAGGAPEGWGTTPLEALCELILKLAERA